MSIQDFYDALPQIQEWQAERPPYNVLVGTREFEPVVGQAIACSFQEESESKRSYWAIP